MSFGDVVLVVFGLRAVVITAVQLGKHSVRIVEIMMILVECALGVLFTLCQVCSYS